ncbi:MAG: hypothetical protein RR555_03725 [Bacteroidales bacterium]
MNFLVQNGVKLLWGIVAGLCLLNNSIPAIAQSKVFDRTASSPDYAYSASNENYVFYTVSAGNTDGGFNYMGIIREDKKTKERAVLYKGKWIINLMVCGDWVYYETTSGHIDRVKVDGSKHELIKIGDRPFIYKERLYFSEYNALKFYDLKTMDVKTASTQITALDAICDDVAVIFDELNATCTMAQLDPTSGVVTSVSHFKINGLDQYYHKDVMVNDGYLYYRGTRKADKNLYPSIEPPLYRSKLGDNNAAPELVACAPTLKTGGSMNMKYTLGTVMDDDCLYINYRAMQSPDNGEIWRYSLDGKVKKRLTILLTNAMSKCEDWIYSMGQWTWEQRRTNVKTGKQELLFNGKNNDLSSLSSLKDLTPKTKAVVHPKSITAAAKPEAILRPNNPQVVVDKLHKYKQQGYSISADKYAKKYYRVADVAEMLSKTDKAFNYKIEGNTVTFTLGSYTPHETLKKRYPSVSLPATRRTGYMVKGSVKSPITYYEADGEQFYLFRDILGIMEVKVEGSSVTTTAAK